MLTFHSLRVAEIHPDAEDAVGISLDVPPELRAEYRGLPGQHIVVRAKTNGQENRRTYSVVSAPGESPLRIVTRVHPSGRVSRYLAEQLNAGDRLDVLPPNGSFTPRVTGTKGTYVAFAAGCGITPVLAIVRSLLEAHDGNRVTVFYGNVSTGRAMCLEELLALKDRYLERLSLHFVMSREPQEVELYNGRIDGERVRQFAQSLFDPAAVTEYFVCGPGSMIEEVTGALRGLGVGADHIHGEHFTVATASAAEGGAETVAIIPSSPPPAVGSGPAPDMAEVTVLMDGRRRSFTMRMNDETVLDAAANAGLELPFSCRAGVCSTCRTKVVRGKVEMAQNYALEEWEVEQGYVLACQSRVKTPTLELDYDEK
ncbi:MAG TPA: 2Fe-2S iron-sulfur cluster-binding protein [Steroidobacteraceae bacterium]|nr:2Fe-2S iron-sulfur cluster-binding protein [Steroidobacteraceae bacterium]